MSRIFTVLVCVFLSGIICAQDSDPLPANDAINNVIIDKSGITIETRIVVEMEGEKTKIVFWQETENGFIFKGINWKGDAALLLDNGETIRLEDSKMKGGSIQRGAYVGGFLVPDLYQRYAAYYLSEQECDLLKKSSVMLVSYTLDDKYNKGTQYLEIKDNNRSLKGQLIAIGK